MKIFKFSKLLILVSASFIYCSEARAQLTVRISSPTVSGEKALVPLAMKNNLGEKVESARAVCFLLDEQGQMVGQSTKWVIGQNRIGLDPGATNTYNFVITGNHPFAATNLTAKVAFSQLVLEGGKAADIKKDVEITP